MATLQADLLKFFEGKESSYNYLYHSGGLYFAKDTGVIIFRNVKYGSKPDLSNYATKSDIANLGLASSLQDGLMSKTDKSKLDTLPTSFKTLNGNSISGPGNILPTQLIGSGRYDILDDIFYQNIGVNAILSGKDLTIGLYNFDTSTWIGASRVTVTLPALQIGTIDTPLVPGTPDTPIH